MDEPAPDRHERWAGERELHQMDVLVWEVMRLLEELEALKKETPDRGAVGRSQAATESLRVSRAGGMSSRRR